jgi:hypothetical protein
MNTAERPTINGIHVPNSGGERSATRPHLEFPSLLFQSTLHKPG